MAISESTDGTSEMAAKRAPTISGIRAISGARGEDVEDV